MGTLKIARERKFIGCAAALYCFVSDSFLDENSLSVCNYIENGKSKTLSFDSDVVAIKCRVGAFRQVDAPQFGEVYVIDFKKHPIVNAHISLKSGISFADEKGSAIKLQTLLEYANESPYIETKEWFDMMKLYQTFVPTETFAPSKQYHGKLAVDEKRQKWAYFDNGITLVNHSDHKTYSFSDIVSFEIIENGSSITKGGLGAAAVGGALFGDAGAIVGATTATKTTTSICHSMQIAITVKDDETPNIYIPIVKTPISTLSKEYTQHMKNARDIIAVLNRIYMPEQKVQIQEQCKIEDLRKYKALLDEGLINADEYDSIKKKILKL
jgi:hypothetical protein